MLDRFRERILERDIRGGEVPSCIALVISAEAVGGRWWRRVGEVAGWCTSLGVREAAIFSEDPVPDDIEDLVRDMAEVPAEGRVVYREGEARFGRGGPLHLVVSAGPGGREEVTGAIRSLLEEVRVGLLDPEAVDEAAIEARLRLKLRPDLLIRLGPRELSDFMIWQSAYSELYFIDRSWEGLKKVDFLLAVRDYQRRERRFGR
ncbi:undecaprenyl diphosphate synthase family protein [Methanothrix harundinacea]|jgi:undecaprenyl diphosphate synthase|uniref:Di-trans,poly-cis-decaprenylcistransferase n=1 Tax=Methanothrix harundinacea (strain 6Ac) TaxID=1110509 RepID=G7WPL9_METH6|nr:undecaprenyl diphosphate synthase family protein [Methanothrix harundinacea]AET65220.1 Di-trans,poly-cis-decaprenylcistransferase [Methanothrix harundinacea 6Ac]